MVLSNYCHTCKLIEVSSISHADLAPSILSINRDKTVWEDDVYLAKGITEITFI